MSETVVIETKENPDCLVLWLHGLGADGYDFEPIVPELHLPDSLKIRFLFPHATRQPVTLNHGMVMRAWYNILGIDRTAEEDLEGIKRTESQLVTLLDEQIAQGIAPEKMVLAGFSQGGAMALHIATRYSKKLAGVIGLSTYLPLADLLKKEKQTVNQDLPIFLAHGDEDPILPLEYACKTKKNLEENLYKVEFHLYKGMAHSLCEEEIADISTFLQKVLAPAP